MSFRDAADRCLGAAMRLLGDRGSYVRAGNARQYPIDYVWHSPHTEVTVGTDVAVSTSAPAVGIRLSDLPFAPARNDRIILASGAPYKVDDVQLDGIAGAVLVLQKV